MLGLPRVGGLVGEALRRQSKRKPAAQGQCSGKMSPLPGSLENLVPRNRVSCRVDL